MNRSRHCCSQKQVVVGRRLLVLQTLLSLMKRVKDLLAEYRVFGKALYTRTCGASGVNTIAKSVSSTNSAAQRCMVTWRQNTSRFSRSYRRHVALVRHTDFSGVEQ